MADTYAVAPDDVAAELPALFAPGFSERTKPDVATVTSWISAADVIATLHVQRAAALVPAASDQAAPLAKRYIIAATKAEVMRAVYAGRAPQDVEQAARGYDSQAKALLAEIDALGTQMAGSGVVANRVRSHADLQSASLDRAAFISDAMLDQDPDRERRY